MAEPNNNVVMVFMCKEEADIAKVFQVMQNPMMGLMLEGIQVLITRGEDEE